MNWCGQQGFDNAAKLIDEDWERMITFYRFPKEYWKRIRTTNVVESPFASPRLRTDAAKRCKPEENATAVIFKMLLVAERHSRRLNAPELMKDIFLGVKFRNGSRVKEQTREGAA